MRLRFLLLLIIASALAWAEDLPAEVQQRFAKRALATMEQRVALAGELKGFGEAGFNALIKLLDDKAWAVRVAAVEALAAGYPEACEKNLDRLAGERSMRMRCSVVFLAAQVRKEHAIDLIQRLAGDRTDAGAIARLAAVEVAPVLFAAGEGKPAEKKTIDLLANLVAKDTDLRVRNGAAKALCTVAQRSPTALRALTEATTALPEDLAGTVVEELLAAKFPEATLVRGFARQLASAPAFEARCIAADALGRIGGPEATEALLTGLPQCTGVKYKDARAAIWDSLGMIAPTDAKVIARIEQAADSIANGDRWMGVRLAAAWALMRIGSKQAIPYATMWISRNEPEDMCWLLQRYTGQRFTTRAEWEKWWLGAKKDWQHQAAFTNEKSSEIDFYDVKDVVSNVVFVLDTSGSMTDSRAIPPRKGEKPVNRPKIEAARTELWRTLRDLQPGTRFSVISFSETVIQWSNGPLRATWRNKWLMREEMDRHSARGGTNSHAGIAAGLVSAGVEAMFFLSDGQPTAGFIRDPDLLNADVVERNQEVPRPCRIHALSFYMDKAEEKIAKSFMERLAKLNGGVYKVVE